MSSFCLPLQPVYPGRTRLVYTARSERRVVYGIVDPHQLTQGVVLVCHRYIVPGLARYVASVVVGVRQVERVRPAALRYRRYQRCRRIRPRVLFLDIKPPLFLVQYL